MGDSVTDTCFNCGQAMPTFIDPFNLSEMRSALTAAFIYWENVSVGDVLSVPKMPANTTATVMDADTDTYSDSYGDVSGSGHVVFQVSDGVRVTSYKIEGYSSSYNGWAWDEQLITEVRPETKTITTWEHV